MARDAVERFTVSEWKVMKIVWQRRSASARDVHKLISETECWSKSTTKTVLSRLVRKKHLFAIPVGSSFLYRPARSAWRSLMDEADSLLDTPIARSP
jgi:predicted transcriptional regulator